MDNKFVLSDSFNDLVFEGRNKAYGAYQHRRRYGNQMLISALITCGLVAGLFVWGQNAMAISQPKQKAIEPKIHIIPIDLPENGTLNEVPKPKTEPKPKVSTPDVPKSPVASEQLTTNIAVTNTAESKTPANNTGGDPNGNIGGLGAGTPAGDCEDCFPELLPEPEPVKPEPIPVWVEQMPENEALYGYLAANIRYPKDARDRGDQGVVIIEFVVNKDGTYRDIKIARGVCPSIDLEALRVARKMPRWKPGKQNGVAVDVLCRQPISFKLSE